MKNTILLAICLSCAFFSRAQSEPQSVSVSIFTGLMNYQGDLNPDQFRTSHSHFATGITLRKPLGNWFTIRAGVAMGTIEGADRYNRDNLKSRNLSFYSNIKEAHAALELSLMPASARIIPYVYGGVGVFHFNPWTLDNNQQKVYLQPLGTEGQGLSQYPTQHAYKLTQLMLPFGAGVKYRVSDAISVGIEFNQRKSFTDYIDDVSTHFVDREILMQERGPQAVELAYRADELPGGASYPSHGEQRGTATEMDWFYSFGTTVEIKLDAIGGLFRNKSLNSQRCPRRVL